MPIEFVLSLQEALARMPEARRPSADRLEMYASTFLIPLEYEKLRSLNCPECGSLSWDHISQSTLSGKDELDWPYLCPAGDEHHYRCKQCGRSTFVRFWFTK
jgi:DNA-directed RNA polymerase subunit RPC12/RpoP